MPPGALSGNPQPRPRPDEPPRRPTARATLLVAACVALTVAYRISAPSLSRPASAADSSLLLKTKAAERHVLPCPDCSDCDGVSDGDDDGPELDCAIFDNLFGGGGGGGGPGGDGVSPRAPGVSDERSGPACRETDIERLARAAWGVPDSAPAGASRNRLTSDFEWRPWTNSADPEWQAAGDGGAPDFFGRRRYESEVLARCDGGGWRPVDMQIETEDTDADGAFWQTNDDFTASGRGGVGNCSGANLFFFLFFPPPLNLGLHPVKPARRRAPFSCHAHRAYSSPPA